MTPAMASPTGVARALGYGGLVPFVGLAVGMWWLPVDQQARLASALLAYGACIATFVGAIAWGLAMREPSGPNGNLLVWGVVPSVVAWVALLLPSAYGLGLLAILLWACYAVDQKVYAHMGLVAWLPMRLQLTAVASVCCCAGALRVSGAAV